jgi:hypothetical protein
VAADEQCEQQMLDDLLLPDDDFADFHADFLESRMEGFDEDFGLGGIERLLGLTAQRTISNNICWASR